MPWISGTPVTQSGAKWQKPFLGAIGGVSGIKVWTGSAWLTFPVKIWTGSAWVAAPVKYWTGSTWVGNGGSGSPTPLTAPPLSVPFTPGV